jgi:hypothetical protein
MSRRIRQHNGEIKGGAHSTRGKGPWLIDSFVYGFTDKTQVLHFEHRMHKMRHPVTRRRMYARGSIQQRRNHAALLIRHIPTFHHCILSQDLSRIPKYVLSKPKSKSRTKNNSKKNEMKEKVDASVDDASIDESDDDDDVLIIFDNSDDDDKDDDEICIDPTSEEDEDEDDEKDENDEK